MQAKPSAIKNKWRSEWLDWQPPKGNFDVFDGSIPGESQKVEGVENKKEIEIEIEQCALPLPSKTSKIPSMPLGVKLIQWSPKQPPVGISRVDVVTDVEGFIADTLEQLGRLLNRKAQPGTARRLRDLVDTLEQCGCLVQIRGVGSRSGGQP